MSNTEVTKLYGAITDLRRPFGSRAGAVVLFAAFFAPAAGLMAAEPKPITIEEAGHWANSMDRAISRVRSQLQAISQDFRGIAPQEVAEVERRLYHAKHQLASKEYERAAIHLIDVIESPATRSHPLYDECLFLLASALVQTKNYTGARRYYEELLERAQGDRMNDVVLGLLEVAAETRSYDSVDRYIGHLRDAGSLSRPDVDYIYGKMLFKGAGSDAARLREAYQAFQRVPPKEKVGAQASYYGAVVLVREGRLSEASAQFQVTLDLLPSTPEGKTLRNLTHLSLGRVYQELNKFDESVEAYQKVARDSPYYGEALFEMAWAHVHSANEADDEDVQKEKYQKALKATEVLMATSPGPRLFPEARLLQGNLEIRLGGPETAYETFQTIVDRYGGARAKLQKVLRETTDLKQFFDQLVAADLSKVGSNSIIPPLAVEWAFEQKSMERAVAMQQQLADGQAYLEESRKLIKTLEDALAGERKYALIPGLSRSRGMVVAAENELIELRRQLLELERRITWPYASERARRAITRASAGRSALEAEIRALPKSEVQLVDSRRTIEASYKEVDMEAFRRSSRIATMRSEIAAVETWLNQNRERLSPGEVDLVEERLAVVQNQIDTIEGDFEDLHTDLSRAKALATGASGAGRIHDQFTEIAATELALLRESRSRVPSGYQPVLARIDAQRQRVSGELERDAVALQAELDRTVSTRSETLRTLLSQESQRLASYHTEHDEIAAVTDHALGPVAAQALNAVGQEFRQLVLQADVGIIDVAWTRKLAETAKINGLVKEQQEQTRELENELEGVLED